MVAAPDWPARTAQHLLVSGSQMAALEQQLFSSGLPVEALMEKAALAIARALLQHEQATLHRDGVLVLVGPGHNGGDGLVVARELHLAGVPVRIWSPFTDHKPLTASHLRHVQWLGVPRLEQPPDPNTAELWIDGLFGIGQHRPLDPPLEQLFDSRNRARAGRLVALDVPSGLCSDQGTCLGRSAARARRTYCLGLLKQGLLQDTALAWVGRLHRLDLGLPAALLAGLPVDQPLALAPADLASAPWPLLDPAAAKYERGRLLVVAGSQRYRGAALLALAGAEASGCGSIRAALPHGLADHLWIRQPQVVVSQTLTCTDSGHLKLDQLPPEALERLDAVLLGPGVGPAQAGSDRATWQMLQQFPGLLVLDADGLNRLSQAQAGASSWLRGRQGPSWITPHRQEFNRLFPRLQGLPALEAAVAAAQLCGASVLLKGARSVIASPEGHQWQLLKAAPEAAQTGLGDVLAGYAAGLGAMAMATAEDQFSGTSGLTPLLAAAALAHASAGLARAQKGPGCAGPLAIAKALSRGCAR